MGAVPTPQIAAAIQGHRFQRSAYVQPMGILVNTRLVKPEDGTAKLERSQQSQMEGHKILSDDMRPLGSGNTMFAILQKKMGAAFNEQLAEQKPVFSRDMRNDARRVARGEYPIYVAAGFAFASDLKGLPVKVIIPKEGAPYAQMELALLKNASHANAHGSRQSLPRAGFAVALRQRLDAAGRQGRRREGE